MMKNINTNKILMLLSFIGLFMVIMVAQAQDHRFNYQGELVDDGVPVNGQYDFTVSAFFTTSGGTPEANVSEHTNITVTNGLFLIEEVNLVGGTGINPLDGSGTWLEVAVRPNGVGSYTPLSPRQKFIAVPMADNITRKGAANAQVLTYNSIANQWLPQTPSAHTSGSRWTLTGADISYTDGRVNVGGSSTLAVLSAISSTDAGLYASSNGGFTADIILGANGSGDEGIIRTDPDEPGSDMWLFSNDGVVIQLDRDGNEEGNLEVRDSDNNILLDINEDAHMKQPISGGGMVKYMVSVNCGATATIDRQYVGTVAGGNITANGLGTGSCDIVFPENIDDRFWTVTADYDVSLNENRVRAACFANTNTLSCNSMFADTGTFVASKIVIIVH